MNLNSLFERGFDMRGSQVMFATAVLAGCMYPSVGRAAGLTKVSDHVYAYVGQVEATAAKGFGANAGVVVGRDAALVVDTLLTPKAAERFMADIKKVTDKPVKYVVNTHYHLDHAWGNQVFAGAGAVIMAQENSRKDMTSAAYGLAHPEMFGLEPNAVEGIILTPATILMHEQLAVDLGDVTVELNYPGPTHTNDSITVAVPQDDVMFTGDILFSHYNPYLAEGDITNWIKVLGELQKGKVTKFIPGHGPVSSTKDLAEMRQYLETFDSLARELCKGRTAADAQLLAKEMALRLPAQQRTELPGMIEMNLRARYLPQSEPAKSETGKAR
jgi:cyclase